MKNLAAAEGDAPRRTAQSKGAIVVADDTEKYALPSRFGDKPKSVMLDYVLDSVWTVPVDIFVVFRDEPSLALIESIAPYGVKVVIDRERDTLHSRIFAGLRASCSSTGGGRQAGGRGYPNRGRVSPQEMGDSG